MACVIIGILMMLIFAALALVNVCEYFGFKFSDEVPLHR